MMIFQQLSSFYYGRKILETHFKKEIFKLTIGPYQTIFDKWTKCFEGISLEMFMGMRLPSNECWPILMLVTDVGDEM